MSEQIKIVLLRENATIPSYQTEHAAGMDVAACIDGPVTIEPHGRAIIPTGFALALPPGYAGFVHNAYGIIFELFNVGL